MSGYQEIGRTVLGEAEHSKHMDVRIRSSSIFSCRSSNLTNTYRTASDHDGHPALPAYPANAKGEGELQQLLTRGIGLLP